MAAEPLISVNEIFVLFEFAVNKISNVFPDVSFEAIISSYEPASVFMRPALYVPELQPVEELLVEMKKNAQRMAIVVDEYGGTSGIVTLEDILEEIVGEINDEFDIAAEDVDFTKIDEKNYLFEGKTTLNDFYKILGVEEKVFDEIKGESDTIAGLILENQGKIPEKNTIIQLQNFTFRVEAVDNRRIKRIKVTIN